MDPDCIEVMLPNDNPGPSGHIPNIAMAIDPTYPRAQHYKSYSHENPSNTTSPVKSLPPPGIIFLKQARSVSNRSFFRPH